MSTPQKRRITIAPAPTSVNAAMLAKELAGVRVTIDPADIAVGSAGVTLLYLSDAPMEQVETAIRTIVAAHAPPLAETDSERIARLAKESQHGQAPNDLALLALAYLCWKGITNSYEAVNAIRLACEKAGVDVESVPQLHPFETFADCVAAWKSLIDAIASGKFSPQ